MSLPFRYGADPLSGTGGHLAQWRFACLRHVVGDEHHETLKVGSDIFG